MKPQHKNIQPSGGGLFLPQKGDNMDKLYSFEHQMRATGNFYKFADTADIKTLKNYDEYAENDIKRATELIEALTQYRLDLYEHCQKAAQLESYQELRLTRHKKWSDNKIYYYVEIYRMYYNESIKPILEQSNTFKGTERQKAKELFEKLKKENPHIKTVIDIAKKNWEK